MYTGVVKFFNTTKNFGFIKSVQEGEADFFFHGSKILVPVKENDQVTFEVVEGKKGPEAINVDLIRNEE